MTIFQDIVNGSDHSSMLQLTNLVAGRYVFTLIVKDAEGEHDRDTASVIVRQNPKLKSLMELRIGASLSSFTEANKV